MSGADTIRSLYDLMATGRMDEAAAILDPDIEWDTTEAPTGVRTRGIQGLRADLLAMLDAWEAYESVPEQVLEADDAVVVIVRNRGRGAGGGVPIEARRAHVWRLRDGRPASMRLYLDPGEALKGLGLDERR